MFTPKGTMFFILVVVVTIIAPPVRTQKAGQADLRQRKIVFDSERDGDQEIYVMNPDGSNQQRLTNRKGNDRHPTWSPDGKRIAFASDRDGNMATFAMDPDSANVTRLTKSAGKHDNDDAWGPEWSPDGKRITFESDRAGNEEDIYVMDADGSNVQRLTHTPGSGKFSSDQAWSPDGNWIAFLSGPGAKSRTQWSESREIYVMDADGSNVQRLTFNKAYDGHHDW